MKVTDYGEVVANMAKRAKARDDLLALARYKEARELQRLQCRDEIALLNWLNTVVPVKKRPPPCIYRTGCIIPSECIPDGICNAQEIGLSRRPA